MLFNSFAFIFLFLPASLLAWFGLHRLGYTAPAKFALIVLSLLFYGLFSVWNVPVILVSILVNFAISAGFQNLTDLEEVEEVSVTGRKKFLLVFGILFNILYLCAFKYASAYEGILRGRFSLPEDFSILFPIGISYYTLSQISFVADRYREETEHDTFLNFTLTTVFFPKLAEGPIIRYGKVAPQFHDPKRREFSPDAFMRGLVRFFLGLAKKVLIADRLAPASAFGFANAYYLDTLTVIVFLAATVFQLYFDFSGYIDMALGIAQMFRIDLPENFNSPFQAKNFAGFWRRWHISLTGFFTRYVYIPPGGQQEGSPAHRRKCNPDLRPFRPLARDELELPVLGRALRHSGGAGKAVSASALGEGEGPRRYGSPAGAELLGLFLHTGLFRCRPAGHLPRHPPAVFLSHLAGLPVPDGGSTGDPGILSCESGGEPPGAGLPEPGPPAGADFSPCALHHSGFREKFTGDLRGNGLEPEERDPCRLPGGLVPALPAGRHHLPVL